jgi:hypothetical protein
MFLPARTAHLAVGSYTRDSFPDAPQGRAGFFRRGGDGTFISHVFYIHSRGLIIRPGCYNEVQWFIGKLE